MAMQIRVPPYVRQMSKGRMVITAHDTDAVVYIRDDDWGMRNYPRQCPAELRIGTWDVNNAMAAVLLVRLARSDLTTFESWMNAADPNIVRVLQCLASQSQIDIHVVADSEVRSLRAANKLQFDASQIINAIRSRDAWSDADFQAACSRIAQLYPTPHALWRACPEAGAP